MMEETYDQQSIHPQLRKALGDGRVELHILTRIQHTNSPEKLEYRH